MGSSLLEGLSDGRELSFVDSVVLGFPLASAEVDLCLKLCVIGGRSYAQLACLCCVYDAPVGVCVLVGLVS